MVSTHPRIDASTHPRRSTAPHHITHWQSLGVPHLTGPEATLPHPLADETPVESRDRPRDEPLDSSPPLPCVRPSEQARPPRPASGRRRCSTGLRLVASAAGKRSFCQRPAKKKRLPSHPAAAARNARTAAVQTVRHHHHLTTNFSRIEQTMAAAEAAAAAADHITSHPRTPAGPPVPCHAPAVAVASEICFPARPLAGDLTAVSKPPKAC